MKLRKFTAEEHAFMREFVPGHSHKEIKSEFFKRFGYLPESKCFPKSYINNHKLNTGRTGRFQKGHTPANKGKHVSPEVYEKCEKTMFKAGHKPHNTEPVGTEKMLTDGYIWVKVNDKPKTRKYENWTQKHRLIYEKEHGEIPEGHFVTFLDGDRTNFDIENLALISRAENAVMNKFGLRWDDANATKVGINIAKIKLEITGRSE